MIAFSAWSVVALSVVSCAKQAGSGEEAGKIIRPPAVAGGFYPGDAGALRATVEKLLGEAKKVPIEGRIVGLIAPHAGYGYSGPTAAAAFKQLEGRPIGTVILIGSSHRASFPGAAVWSGDGWMTPLGLVPVDRKAAEKLVSTVKGAALLLEAHREEHSLEVELPFLQTVLKSFLIVPVLIGGADPATLKDLGKAMAEMIREDPGAVIVCSTDLTHYPPYAEAQRIDRETLEAIRTMDIEALSRIEARCERSDVPNLVCAVCGERAVLAAMEAAVLLGVKEAKVVDQRNSGDAPMGDKSRVVGYGAAIFSLPPGAPSPLNNIKNDGKQTEEKMSLIAKEPEGLSPAARARLLSIARSSLNAVLNRKPFASDGFDNPELQARRGMFVTLTKRGDLRGCMGHFDQDVPLYELAARQAVVSAVEDPRFPPVESSELQDIKIEISVLSPPRPVASWRDIEVGKHGVILRQGMRGATFLPQVAPEQGWDREEMLTHLSLKAGLAPDAWKEGAKFEVYTAQVFGEAR
jgi:hypothetical protein